MKDFIYYIKNIPSVIEHQSFVDLINICGNFEIKWFFNDEGEYMDFLFLATDDKVISNIIEKYLSYLIIDDMYLEYKPRIFEFKNINDDQKVSCSYSEGNIKLLKDPGTEKNGHNNSNTITNQKSGEKKYEKLQLINEIYLHPLRDEEYNIFMLKKIKIAINELVKHKLNNTTFKKFFNITQKGEQNTIDRCTEIQKRLKRYITDEYFNKSKVEKFIHKIFGDKETKANKYNDSDEYFKFLDHIVEKYRYNCFGKNP